MDASFQLGSAEHDQIYSTTIEPIAFLDTSAVDTPTMIIVAAQTGAGKSKLVEAAIKELGANVVSVNTDDLRAYHPKYDEIVMMDDLRAAERTHHDASTWKNRLFSRSIETRRNIILEGVFKDNKGVEETIDTAKKAGYRVIVRVVAAHARYSVWGVYRRYEKEKIVRGHGRYVPIEYHDECYAKLLETVAAIEVQKSADVIEVYDRNGSLLYANEVVNNDWKEEPLARQAVEQERNRVLTETERKQYIESWPRVFEYMTKRAASSEEFEKVKKLVDRFIAELNKGI